MMESSDLRIRELKDLNVQLNITIRNQNILIESLQKDREADRKQNQELTEKILVLSEQLEYLQKKLFGTSSERSRDIPGQMSIFNEAEQEQDVTSEMDFPEEMLQPEDEEKTPGKSKRSHSETFKGIPVKKEVIPLPEEERICPECGTGLVKVGEEYVRTEFRFVPAKGYVVKIYRETWKCPVCTEEAGNLTSEFFIKSIIEEPLIPNSYVSPSVAAWIMYRKFVDAVPLYRQEMDWKQLGVPLLRATMANWMIVCAKNYLKPLYDHLYRQLMKRTFLMADETRVQVLKEPGRNPETDSFMWLFRSGEDGLAPIILFYYTETRKKANAEDFLRGTNGYLMCDGYQGYNSLPGLKRCSCYAHIRRYFVDAVPKGKELDLSNTAVQGVYYCNKLFEIERHCTNRKFTPEQRKAYRDEKAGPVIKSFIKWLKLVKAVNGSRLDKAVKYTLNQEAYLTTYLEDGRCSLSNNLSEVEIHPFTTGRKNWLFSDTPKGAESSAIIYSIVECAKANCLNIYKYLNWLLMHKPSQKMTDDELDRLVPWSSAAKAQCNLEVE